MLRILELFLSEIWITKMSNSYDFLNLIWTDWDTYTFKVRLNNHLIRTTLKEFLNVNCFYNFLTKDFKNKKLPL